MYRAMEMEYNPLENYDRIEEWTDNESNARNASTSTSTHGTTAGTDSQSHYVYGFNDNSQVLQSSDVNHDSGENHGSTSIKGNETGTVDSVHSGRTHGNIGVTTSQQMLSAELDLAPRLNMYDVIAKDFRNRFCILVY